MVREYMDIPDRHAVCRAIGPNNLRCTLLTECHTDYHAHWCPECCVETTWREGEYGPQPPRPEMPPFDRGLNDALGQLIVTTRDAARKMVGEMLSPEYISEIRSSASAVAEWAAKARAATGLD